MNDPRRLRRPAAARRRRAAARSPLLPRPGIALSKSLRDGYDRTALRSDVLAGLVVGVVALPLSMALAIAVGAPPQHGLYAAIVSAAVIALLGGSRVQVSGPTAAFVAILAPVTARYGMGGLLLATVLAGLILMLLGIARLGRLVEFVPYPVTTGFTAGIAIVIATLQIRDFLGLTMGPAAESYTGKLTQLAGALPTLDWPEASIGLLTLALLVLWPRLQASVPAPIVALSAAALAALALEHVVPGLEIATIERRFAWEIGGVAGHGVPPLPPLPALPWTWTGPGGEPIELSWQLLRELLPVSFAIAMLGAIESLLSAVVADGMIRRQHDPDAELFAQGLGNVVGPFFGAITATGAIARTATNIRSGARSPVAALVHSGVLLLATLSIAPLLGKLPMASLAALLLLVAWNMSEARHVLRTLRTAPRSDGLILLSCLALTVLFDMVVAVTAGVLLAALLFMRRMVEVTQAELVAEPHRRLRQVLPSGVVLYEIAGPLFFGAAARAMRALHSVDASVRLVVLDLRSVPALDATGLVALDSAVDRLTRAQIDVVLAGVQPQPLRALLKAGWRARRPAVEMSTTFARGLSLAARRVAGDGAAP